jgi:hypothetical protein
MKTENGIQESEVSRQGGRQRCVLRVPWWGGSTAAGTRWRTSFPYHWNQRASTVKLWRCKSLVSREVRQVPKEIGRILTFSHHFSRRRYAIFLCQWSVNPPHPILVASQAHHKLVAPKETSASRFVVPQWGASPNWKKFPVFPDVSTYFHIFPDNGGKKYERTVNTRTIGQHETVETVGLWTEQSSTGLKPGVNGKGRIKMKIKRRIKTESGRGRDPQSMHPLAIICLNCRPMRWTV